MNNYKDLSSEELKRTLAEKQDILRRTMKPDEYKKFMQELDDCQIKIDYSKFGKPVQGIATAAVFPLPAPPTIKICPSVLSGMVAYFPLLLPNTTPERSFAVFSANT